MKSKLLLALCFALMSASIYAQTEETVSVESNNEQCKCADGDCHFSTAPINVMGDHTHHEGGFMFSYRMMNMHMHGNLLGSHSVSDATIAESYTNVPYAMHMNMHMLGIMYGASSDFTLMVMGMYSQKDMNSRHYITETADEHDHSSHDHSHRIGSGDHDTKMTAESTTFSNNASGLGDIKVSALYNLFNTKEHSLVFQLGVSLPTGSIDEMGSSPQMETMKLPYAMQLGTGTLDFLGGVAYMHNWSKFFFGNQMSYTMPMNESKYGYKWGMKTDNNFWFGYKVNPSFSATVSMNSVWQGKMTGSDTEVMATMAPPANSNNYGGSFNMVSIGANYYVNKGMCQGLKLGISYQVPTSESYNGIQMAREQNLWFGIQYML